MKSIQSLKRYKVQKKQHILPNYEFTMHSWDQHTELKWNENEQPVMCELLALTVTLFSLPNAPPVQLTLNTYEKGE